MAIDRKKMSRLHEEHIAEAWGGEVQRGSGNQWNNPGDVRENHVTTPVAVCADGKATAGASIAIARADLRKLAEQAGAEIPVLPVRFYDDERLQDYADYVLLREEDGLRWREGYRSYLEAEENPPQESQVPEGMTMIPVQELARLQDIEASSKLTPGEIGEMAAALQEQLDEGGNLQGIPGIVILKRQEFTELVNVGRRMATPPDGSVILSEAEWEQVQQRIAASGQIPPEMIVMDPAEILRLREEAGAAGAAGAAAEPVSRHYPEGYIEVIQDRTQPPEKQLSGRQEGEKMLVWSVRIEHGAGTESMLIVNDVRVRNGCLIRDGVPMIYVGEQPS